MPIGLQIGSLCFLAAGVAALAVWAIRRKSSTPEKREQRRRLTLHATGRIGDALVTEGTEETLFYTYTVRRVQYTASQDITSLRSLLPSAPERLIGMAGMKYSTRNPADSMLLCEEWSGLRKVLAHAVLSNDDVVRHQPQNAALTKGA
ncbi:MAG: hypothetical protein EXQ47_00085 [Bryobacterales bacterium]|nr:hypothetical protein [Bryobacterales bacterium]